MSQNVILVGRIGIENMPIKLIGSAKERLKGLNNALRSKGIKMVNKIVPKDTGKLRRALIGTFKKSFVDDSGLYFYIGTYRSKIAKYMTIVNENEMGKRLAHSRYHKRQYSRTNKPGGNAKILHDPKAEERFLEKISAELYKMMERRVTLIKIKLIREAEKLNVDMTYMNQWIYLTR